MRRLTVSAFLITAVSLICHEASGKPIAIDDALLDETNATTYYQDASTPNLAEKVGGFIQRSQERGEGARHISVVSTGARGKGEG